MSKHGAPSLDHVRHLAKEVRVLIGIGLAVLLIVIIAAMAHAGQSASNGVRQGQACSADPQDC